MKIFLSWSGNTSHQVALVLRDWLPSIIQAVEPYVSSEDIDKGTRWSSDISRELEDTAFGILCVTKKNINAPWLLFEAGALSNKLDKSFVSPFLFDIKRSEINGPILQFQSTIVDEADILKLVKTINKACGEEKLKDDRLLTAFNVWYPKLDEALKNIEIPEESKEDNKNVNKSQEILEEILELSRSNQRILTDPNSILPLDYLSFVFNRYKYGNLNDPNFDVVHRILTGVEDFEILNHNFKEIILTYKNDKKIDVEKFEMLLSQQNEVIEYIKATASIRRKRIDYY